MIRVLHCIATLEIGGEQRYLARLSRGLDPARFEQWVAHAPPDDLRSEFAPEVQFLQVLDRRPTARDPRTWRLAADFARLIRRHRIDLVTTHGAGILYLAASAAARLLGKPAVHTIQRPFANRARTEDVTVRVPGLRQAVYALTDRFVALGSYYARDQQERFKIPADKIVLSYIGIELERYRPDPALGAEGRRLLGIDSDVPVIGVVARQDRQKGIARGLRCFADVRAAVPAARLLLVGDGRERPDNERLARELGLGDAAMFTGARTDTPRMMNACDVILQTTHNPLNGISSIEGMAVGKPIVTIVDSAEEERMAADTCEEGTNGLYFRVADRAQSVARLAALLGDAPRRAELGRASRRLAEERFDLAKHARDIAAVYEELTAVAFGAAA